ncbi:hypothetical protein FF1_039345 [Malus domestica]
MATSGALTSTGPKPVVTDEVLKVFKSFDASGDGKISVNELGNDLKALGFNVSNDKLKRVKVDLDTDNDGFICLDEFNAFWVSSSLNRSPKPTTRYLTSIAICQARDARLVEGKTKNPIQHLGYSGSKLISSYIFDLFGFAIKGKSDR